MRSRNLIIGLIGIAALIALAVFLIPNLSLSQKVSLPAYWPTQGWRTSTPEEQGFDSEKLLKLVEFIRGGNIQVDSVLFIRNGSIVMDAYFYDPYDGSIPHDMASVTKSITTTLIGIAADQGKLDLDKPVVTYSPEREIANLDARKEKVTVRHLAGMVNGFESGCMADDAGTIGRMQSSPDWVQSALDRKIIQDPGKVFCYDSPGMHLLSAVLQEATGMTELEFGRQYLFEPLGIQNVFWDPDPQGYTYGWGDIHLLPQDAAKIAYLFMNHGNWEGKQIVSEEWVKAATTSYVMGDDDQYRYGWWISEDAFYASGRGGQKVFAVPALNTIVVITGSGYEYDEIAPYLEAAVLGVDDQIPDNPQGDARLDAAIKALVKEQTPMAPEALPDIAREVSGKTYTFDENTFGVETGKIEFDDPAQVVMTIQRTAGEIIWRIGLDNVFRHSSDGLWSRGRWQDPQTLVIELFDVGMLSRTIHFEGDDLTLIASGMRFTGHIVKP